MALEISIEVNPSHVVMSAVGMYSVDSALDLFGRAFAAANREGVDAALVDVRAVEGMPADLERFEIGKFVANHRGDHVRLALVGTPAVAERASLTEDVANNRGGEFRVFADMELATAWLGQEAG